MNERELREFFWYEKSTELTMALCKVGGLLKGVFSRKDLYDLFEHLGRTSSPECIDSLCELIVVFKENNLLTGELGFGLGDNEPAGAIITFKVYGNKGLMNELDMQKLLLAVRRSIARGDSHMVLSDNLYYWARGREIVVPPDPEVAWGELRAGLVTKGVSVEVVDKWLKVIRDGLTPEQMLKCCRLDKAQRADPRFTVLAQQTQIDILAGRLKVVPFTESELKASLQKRSDALNKAQDVVGTSPQSGGTPRFGVARSGGAQRRTAEDEAAFEVKYRNRAGNSPLQHR